MTLKKFLLLVVIFIAASAYFMLNHMESYITFIVVAAILAAIYELIHYFKKQKIEREFKFKKSRFQETHDEDGNVYHNDFSKVPAGIVDPDAPPLMPRSMNVIDPKRSFEASFEEDLKRAGLVDMLESDEEKLDKDKK